MERTSPIHVGSGAPRLNFHVQSSSEEVMRENTTVGLDLAKRVVRVARLNGVGALTASAVDTPDTELQLDPSSMQCHLLFRGRG
jgi:hypothetical protein